MDSWVTLVGVMFSAGLAFFTAWVVNRKPADLREAAWLSELIETMSEGAERNAAADLRDGLVARWSMVRIYPLNDRQRRRRRSIKVIIVGSGGASVFLFFAVLLSGLGANAALAAAVFTLLAILFFLLAGLAAGRLLFLGDAEATAKETDASRAAARTIYGLHENVWSRFKTVAEQERGSNNMNPQ